MQGQTKSENLWDKSIDFIKRKWYFVIIGFLILAIKECGGVFEAINNYNNFITDEENETKEVVDVVINQENTPQISSNINDSLIIANILKVKDDDELYYTHNFDDNGQLIVIPNHEYFDLIKQGGILEPFNYGINTKFPKIKFGLINNSNEVDIVQKIELIVIKSIVDPTPILNIHDFHVRAFGITNFNWVDPINIRINYNIIYPMPKFDKNYTYSNYRFEKYFDNFSDAEEISLVEDFKEIGLMNLEYLQEQIYGDTNNFFRNITSITRKLNHPLNDYNFVDAVIVGQATYSWINEVGEEKENTVKFKTRTYVFPDGLGDAHDEDSLSYSVLLETNSENYLKTIYPNTTLNPKSNEWLDIILGSEKSSFHELIVKFHFSSGRVIEKGPIKVNVFMPTTWYHGLRKSNIEHGQIAKELFDESEFIEKNTNGDGLKLSEDGFYECPCNHYKYKVYNTPPTGRYYQLLSLISFDCCKMPQCGYLTNIIVHKDFNANKIKILVSENEDILSIRKCPDFSKAYPKVID